MQQVNYTLIKYKSDFFSKQDDTVQTKLKDLETKIDQSSDSLSKIKAYSDLIEYYNRLESPENSARVVFDKAGLINNPNSWELCGDNFIALLLERKADSNLVSDIGRYAISSYENSVELDSNKQSSKIKLAQCYMELANEPMKGVQLLLGVTRSDSNNVEAQFLLAKFGLVSGQIEKVLIRLGKVLSLQPQNIEARLMRVDAYMQSGNKVEAIKDLKYLKALKTVPSEMRNQLEVAIKDIESKK